MARPRGENLLLVHPLVRMVGELGNGVFLILSLSSRTFLFVYVSINYKASELTIK